MAEKQAVIASFHLLKYRRKRFRRPKAIDVDGRTFWRSLSIGPDFRLIEPGFGSLDLARPNFHRWGFFGVWRDEDALSLFLSTPASSGGLVADAEEAWHVSLKPIRSMGTWQGEKLLGAFDAIGHSNGPVVALTRGDLRPSKLPAFWLSGTKIAVEDVRSAEGFIAGVAMTERPFLEVATLTVWSSIDRAVEFAYQRQARARLLARNREERIFSAFFSAYFSPYRSAGTWNGRDPLADARERWGQVREYVT